MCTPFRFRLAGLLLVPALLAYAWPALAGAPVSGPVAARLVEITDGDSFKAVAAVWPGMEINVTVRLRGLDAPELRGKCFRERRLAKRARHRLAQLLDAGEIRLVNVSGGKYYGRVLADVVLADGRDISAMMLESGFAVPYAGGKRRRWCG
jgi:micrococcal nuclease